jgi:hypothetical protein
MYNIEKAIQKAMDQMTMYMDEKASTGIEQRKNLLLIISCHPNLGSSSKTSETGIYIMFTNPRK